MNLGRRFERIEFDCYNRGRLTRSACLIAFAVQVPLQIQRVPHERSRRSRERKCGQVAQVVERSPEKAGVGGSTPSLATTFQGTYSESLNVSQPTVCPQNEGLR